MEFSTRKHRRHWNFRLLKVVLALVFASFFLQALSAETKEPIIALRVMPTTLKVNESFLLELAVYYEDLTQVSCIVDELPRDIELLELQFFRMPLSEFPEIQKDWFDFRGNQVYVRSAMYKPKKAGKITFSPIKVIAGEHEIPIEIPPIFVIPKETEKYPTIFWSQSPNEAYVGEKYHLVAMTDILPKSDFSVSYDVPLDAWVEEKPDRKDALQNLIIGEFEWTPLKAGNIDLPNLRLEWKQNNIERASFTEPTSIRVLSNLKKDSTKTKKQEEEFSLVSTKKEESFFTEPITKEDSSKTPQNVFKDESLAKLSYKIWGLPKTLGIVFFMTSCLGLALAIFFFVKKKKRAFLIFAISAGAFCILLVLRSPVYCEAKGTRLFKIPEEKADVIFRIPEKTFLKVVQKTGNWYYIRMSSGHDGWVLKDEILELKSNLW